MNRRLSWVVATAATLAYGSAAAQETQADVPSTTMDMPSTTMSSTERSGLEVTVGVGFQAGLGYVYKNGQRLDGTRGDVKLSDSANGSVPFLLELGYRINNNWFAGVFGQYAYVLTKENPLSCPTGFDCSSNQFRFGPRVQYHFAPDASFDPFVGVGFGIIMLNSKIEGQTTVPTPVGPQPANLDVDSKTRGPEFLNLTVGGKWRLGESLSLGPALEFTYASNTVRYGTTSVNIPALNVTQEGVLGPVDDGPFGLIVLTLRGTYNL